MSRAAAKEKRKQQVLRAVEAAIRADGAVNFSMRELADSAGVSFATPFNLFGSKDEILAALFNQRLSEQAELTAARAGDWASIENLLHIAIDSCEAYLADAELFRPLMQAVRVQPSADYDDIAQQVLNLWAGALHGCVDGDVIAAEADVDELARRLHTAFRVAFWMWASENLDDDSFREQTLFSAVACLLPVATAEGRKRIQDFLDVEFPITAGATG